MEGLEAGALFSGRFMDRGWNHASGVGAGPVGWRRSVMDSETVEKSSWSRVPGKTGDLTTVSTPRISDLSPEALAKGEENRGVTLKIPLKNPIADGFFNIPILTDVFIVERRRNSF